MPASGHLTARAIHLYRAGQVEDARRILTGILAAEPGHRAAAAWLAYINRQEEQPPAEKPRPLAEMRRAPLWLQAALALAVILLALTAALIAAQTAQIAVLNTANDTLRRERSIEQQLNVQTSAQLQTVQATLAQFQEEYRRLAQREGGLRSQYDDLLARYDELEKRNTALKQDYETLTASYNGLNNQYTRLADIAVTPPYILLKNREVDLSFYRSSGEILYWQIPFDALERDIERGQTSRADLFDFLGATKPQYVVSLDYASGESTSAVDFRRFVDPAPFRQVIGSLYQSADSDEAFIREVWKIISQLTVYSLDPEEETPRYPLETLLAGGGDCEDTSILFASMIKAAPVDWEVDLVYMDAFNPENLEDLNHLAVAVKTGRQTYFIETTSKDEMNPYGIIPMGWYLAVD